MLRLIKPELDDGTIKKVKAKTFEQGELVWKLILPIGTKSSKLGK